MFLRNVGWNSTDYTASHSRRWYSSYLSLCSSSFLYSGDETSAYAAENSTRMSWKICLMDWVTRTLFVYHGTYPMKNQREALTWQKTIISVTFVLYCNLSISSYNRTLPNILILLNILLTVTPHFDTMNSEEALLKNVKMLYSVCARFESLTRTPAILTGGARRLSRGANKVPKGGARAHSLTSTSTPSVHNVAILISNSRNHRALRIQSSSTQWTHWNIQTCDKSAHTDNVWGELKSEFGLYILKSLSLLFYYKNGFKSM
jgi:hypothetical protein